MKNGRHHHLVGQKGAEDCILVALANARTLLGKRPLKYESRRWERLRRVGGCVAGPCCCPDRLCKELGLLVRPIGRHGTAWTPAVLARKKLPVMITVLVWGRSCRYGVRHAALVLECDEREAVIANAVPGRCVVDTFCWDDLWLPLEPCAHTITLSDRPRWQEAPRRPPESYRKRAVGTRRMVAHAKQWKRYPRMEWAERRSTG